jgi:hypothetical protein
MCITNTEAFGLAAWSDGDIVKIFLDRIVGWLFEIEEIILFLFIESVNDAFNGYASPRS